MLIKKQKYKLFTLISVLALLLLLPTLQYSINSLVYTNNQLFSEESPKNAGNWDLTGTPIVIVGNSQWSSKYSSQPWFSGTGSWSDPYVIENVTIDAGSVGSCIYIESSNVYFIIKSCNLTNAEASGGAAGILLQDVNNGKLFENNCIENYIGIRLLRSDNNSISSNYLYDNTGQGIILAQSEYNVIEGNTANNSLYYGLLINALSNNNTIEGNTFGNNKGAVGYGSGIKIINSNDCEVSGNLLSDNDQGIRITDNSHDNEFYNNIIHYNAKYGVLIQDLTRNCNSSVFYNNSFINPLGVNAYDNGSNSIWDNGLIGNYWADYGGEDANDDGIGDIPYLINGDANSQDNYPMWDDGDIVYPTILRNSPSPPFTFGENAPTFNLTIFDLHLHMAWYKLNDTYIHFFTPVNGINIILIDQDSWDALAEGSLSIGFFVNDTSGNLLTMGLAALKELSPEEPPSTPGIPFGHYYLVFLGISILALLIVQIKRGKQRFNFNF